MRKIVSIAIAALLIVLVSSCDFFRGLAGRPGSAYIQEKRARIELKESREAAVRDSLEKVRRDSVARAERFAADSLFAMDTLSKAGRLRKLSSYKTIPHSALRSRYCVVAGAFSQEGNAKRLASKYADAGLEAWICRYRSGLDAVFVAPCDDIVQALDAYRKVLHQPFSSKEVWILVNE